MHYGEPKTRKTVYERTPYRETFFALSAALLVAEFAVAAFGDMSPGWMLFIFVIYVALSGMLFSFGMMQENGGSGIETVSMRRARAFQDEHMKDMLDGYDVDDEFLHKGAVKAAGKPKPAKEPPQDSGAGSLEEAIRTHAELFGGLSRLFDALERLDESAYADLARKAGIGDVSKNEVMEKIKGMACAEKTEIRETISRSLEETMRSLSNDRAGFDDYIRRCMTTTERSDDSGDEGFSVDLDIARLSQGSSAPPSDWSHDPKSVMAKLKKPGAKP